MEEDDDEDEEMEEAEGGGGAGKGEEEEREEQQQAERLGQLREAVEVIALLEAVAGELEGAFLQASVRDV